MRDPAANFVAGVATPRPIRVTVTGAGSIDPPPHPTIIADQDVEAALMRGLLSAGGFGQGRTPRLCLGHVTLARVASWIEGLFRPSFQGVGPRHARFLHLRLTASVSCSCAWLRSRLRRPWKFTDPVRHLARLQERARCALLA
ncbi:hypothetical protein [Paracoccus isoporae]|uniref:hypothetical protein n=1 Tax=Paracoccus isoporae TaxID=591205 RepID=UPI0015A32E46|nr:hypothetical protein [Paracoccus isoporae]